MNKKLLIISISIFSICCPSISSQAQNNNLDDETIADIFTTIEELSNFGYMANQQGYYDLAIKCFNEALIMDSTNLFCIANRAWSYNAIGDYQKSIIEYNRAINIEPNYLFYNNRGLSYELMGKYKEALTDFENAIYMNELIPHPYYNKGRMLLHFDKIDKAIELHQKALELVEIDNERADMLNSLGEIYFEIEDYDNSLECYNEIIDLNFASSYTLTRIGDIYRRTNKIKKSINAYNNAIETFDYVEPLAYLYRAKMNIIENFDKCPECTNDLIKYIELSPEDPIGYETYGVLLYMTQDDRYCDFLKIACEKGSCEIFYRICK